MVQDITLWVGADVHKNTIAICVLRGDSQVNETQEFASDSETVRRVFKKLANSGHLRVAYEAGPCGYTLRRQLEAMGISCEVIAPSLIPKKAGDRVKNDRRDAIKIARMFRAGELTTIRVPTEKEEAARDLLRCREDLMQDLQRERQRLLKFLLRQGIVWRETMNWTDKHWKWLRQLRFDDVLSQRGFDEYLALVDTRVGRLKDLDREIEVLAEKEPWKEQVDRLKCLRGIRTLTAMIILTEVQDFRRFESPRQLMNFLGLTPGLHESGSKSHTLAITKTGNEHVRRVLVEAAWQYTRRPQWPRALDKRCDGQSPAIKREAKEAQDRLSFRYRHLRDKGKKPTVAVVAVAREMLGFIWAIMVKHVNPNERKASPPRQQALTPGQTKMPPSARKTRPAPKPVPIAKETPSPSTPTQRSKGPNRPRPNPSSKPPSASVPSNIEIHCNATLSLRG